MPYPLAAVRPHGSSAPLSLAGIAAYSPYVWMDATRYVGSDGDAIASATDYGSLGGSFAQSTAGKKPTYRPTGINSKPAFQFDGGDCLTQASVALGGFTAIILFQASANGLVYEHCQPGTQDGSYLYTDVTFTISTRRGAVGNSKNHTANWGIGSTNRIVRHQYGGTNALHKLWINSADAGLATIVAVDPGTGTSSDDNTFNIGARNNAASAGLTGHIAQLLFFTPVLSDANAAAVEAIINAYYSVF